MSTSTSRDLRFEMLRTARPAPLAARPATRVPRFASQPTPVTRQIPDLLCLESGASGIGPWLHSRFAITLIRSRAVVRLESRRSMQVEPDTVLLVPPLHAYSVRLLEEDITPTQTLLFSARGTFEQWGSRLPAAVTRGELVAPIAQLMAELARPVRSADRVSEIDPLLERLMMESRSVETVRTSDTGTPLFPLRDYLRAHLTTPVSTATLAEMSGLTESHFIRAFHHEFGLPPHAYHLRLRLAEASRLLEKGQSVSTVAYDCGFADQSHLSRKFKEAYGVAPGAWATLTGGGFPGTHVDSARATPKGSAARARARRQHVEQWYR